MGQRRSDDMAVRSLCGVLLLLYFFVCRDMGLSALHKRRFAFKASKKDLDGSCEIRYLCFLSAQMETLNSMVVSLTKTQRKDGAKSRPNSKWKKRKQAVNDRYK